MRVLAVCIIALLIFGTLAAYQRFVETLPKPNLQQYARPTAEGKFFLEVTLTFPAEVDAFATDQEAAVLVRMAGHDVIRSEAPVAAGETLQANDVQGIVAGRNAFFVRAVPAESSSQVPNAVRVKILRDGELIAENSLWSESGSIVAGEVIIQVE